MVASNSFGGLNLSIVGLGTQYPRYAIKPEALDTLSKRFYPDSPS
jgi:type III polyketide synthase